MRAEANVTENSGLITGRKKTVICGTAAKVFIALTASAGFFILGLWGVMHYHDSSYTKVDGDESSQNSTAVDVASTIGFPLAYIALVCAIESLIKKDSKLYRPWHVTNLFMTAAAAAYTLYRMHETHFISSGEARQSDDSYVPGIWLITALGFGLRSTFKLLRPVFCPVVAEVEAASASSAAQYNEMTVPISAYVSPEDEAHFRLTLGRSNQIVNT